MDHFSFPDLVSLNGKLVAAAEAKISVFDRGLIFADALYEGLWLRDGKVWQWDRHWERLARGLKELKIDCPRATAEQSLVQILATSKSSDAFCYLQISRGAVPREHGLPKVDQAPNILTFLKPLNNEALKQKRQSGVTVYSHPDWRWHRCDLKTTNLLGNCMAKEAAIAKGGDEAILVDEQGYVTEGSHSTVFQITGEELITTPLSGRILPGVTRSFVLELAKQMSLPIREQKYTLTELCDASEVFLTGTTTGIQGVTACDDQLIGKGEVGTTTAKLLDLFYQAQSQDDKLWHSLPRSLKV